MAVPSNPTVTSIVKDALRHSSIYNPKASQVTELSTEGLQTVKTELWASQERDALLEVSVMVLLPIGNGQVNTPDDFDHVVKIDVFSCADSMAFTASAAASATLTAPTTFSADESTARGLYVFTTSGTGSGQYRQVTAYNDSTKVLTITPAWTVTPDATTVAFIGHLRRRLGLDDTGTERLSSFPVPISGFPTRYRQIGNSPLTTDLPALEISPVPDSANYAMVLTYGANLTRLDETGTVFIKHLRERRALWVQGLKVQAQSRYDEARYSGSYAVWQSMLRQYQGHNPTYSRMEPAR